VASAGGEVDPKGPTAVSDQHGRFTIQGVTAGDYSITVSYVGLRRLPSG
jgi:hypothetical protein